MKANNVLYAKPTILRQLKLEAYIHIGTFTFLLSDIELS